MYCKKKSTLLCVAENFFYLWSPKYCISCCSCCCGWCHFCLYVSFFLSFFLSFFCSFFVCFFVCFFLCLFVCLVGWLVGCCCWWCWCCCCSDLESHVQRRWKFWADWIRINKPIRQCPRGYDDVRAVWPRCSEDLLRGPRSWTSPVFQLHVFFCRCMTHVSSSSSSSWSYCQTLFRYITVNVDAPEIRSGYAILFFFHTKVFENWPQYCSPLACQHQFLLWMVASPEFFSPYLQMIGSNNHPRDEGHDHVLEFFGYKKRLGHPVVLHDISI